MEVGIKPWNIRLRDIPPLRWRMKRSLSVRFPTYGDMESGTKAFHLRQEYDTEITQRSTKDFFVKPMYIFACNSPSNPGDDMRA
jgi:hypothetical protein